MLEEIILKAKTGDKKSINLIIKKYKFYIFKKARTYHIPEYNFEDLVQHGYLSVINAIHMYKPNSNSYNGYFLAAIDLNFKALLKDEIKHFREFQDKDILERKDYYAFTLEDEIIAYDEVKKLYKALDKLNSIEREILERHYINEESYKEIACTLDIKYNRIIYLKDNAFKKLKNLI